MEIFLCIAVMPLVLDKISSVHKFNHSSHAYGVPPLGTHIHPSHLLHKLSSFTLEKYI